MYFLSRYTNRVKSSWTHIWRSTSISFFRHMSVCKSNYVEWCQMIIQARSWKSDAKKNENIGFYGCPIIVSGTRYISVRVSDMLHYGKMEWLWDIIIKLFFKSKFKMFLSYQALKFSSRSKITDPSQPYWILYHLYSLQFPFKLKNDFTCLWLKNVYDSAIIYNLLW